jgi:hypothetical protein
MHTLLKNKALAITTLISTLVFTAFSIAEENKAALVDEIIHQSSIKIAVQSIPQQLAQIPQMLPVSEEDKPKFLENFMGEIASNYNEADALNAIRNYFIENGDVEKLKEVQQWLTSPMGRRITQAELLNQQLDIAKFQAFLQAYKPSNDSKRRQEELVQLNEVLDFGNRIFALFETLVPKMFNAMSEASPTLEQENAEDFSSNFKQQLGVMREGFREAMSSQMIASMAYQFRDVSDEELSAYVKYMRTEAGQHFLDLSLYSGVEYTTDWMLNTLPNVMKRLEAVETLN